MKDDKVYPDKTSTMFESDFPDKDSATQQEREELFVLARMLHMMPDREPPPDLAEAVVQSVEPKRISIWRRVYLWANTPRSITFSPIKLIPATAVIVLLAVALTVLLRPTEQSLVSMDQGVRRSVPVMFSLKYPQARSVSLIGSFNQWNPEGFEMRARGGGEFWVFEIELPEGRHEYAFLVDGKLVMADPSSPFSESDGFGNRNSIVYVTYENGKPI
jgi:hypothetical protein